MDEMKAQIVDSEIGSKCLKLVDHSGAVFVNHGHMGRGTFVFYCQVWFIMKAALERYYTSYCVHLLH